MNDLSQEDLRIITIALRKAARTSHPDLAFRERELAYRIAKLIVPPFHIDEILP